MDRRSVLRLGALGGAAAAANVLPFTASAAPGRVADPASLPTYLTGVLAPVRDETDAQNLVVEGAIPAELVGRYFRNGPNPHPGVDPGNWWRGDGMVHGLRLRHGRAEWYRNRWVRTLHGPPTLPDGTRDLRVGPANTSVKHHAGKIMALVETAYPYQLTPELDTVGVLDFGGQLRTAMTAHPKVHPRTGEMHFFGYAQKPPYATYHRLSPAGELIRSVPIDLPEAIMMHDFAITDRYVIWLDHPVVWDAASAETGFPNWSDRHEPRIGVMPHNGTSADIRWFTVGPRWAWHVGNAFEDRAGRIVVDAISGDAADWAGTQKFFTGVAGGRAHGHLYRWTLDPATGRVSEHDLDDVATEFPSINDDRLGLGHRYVYSPTTPLMPTKHNRIVKHDTRTGARAAHYLGADRVSGEAVFVPARGGRSEDDGWLMAIVHDLTRKAASLLILDATAPARRPVATVHLPREVPYGFHGEWIPDSELKLTPGN
nr:carotenoid oxygenase family protein [Kibdelosporangium sp. MJ126-NF4]CTQ90713.1 Lignostilbene-alpha,beta-dioxygenase and related enzymes [Kibdelosporangium sp. MJ126-NF4]